MHDVYVVGIPVLVILIGIMVNKHDVSVLRNEMRAGFNGIRSETRVALADLRSETKTAFDNIRSETKAAFGDLRGQMRVDFSDVKGQIQHLVDLHINHEGRISKVEERTK
jgi:hypothetical protein